MPKRKPVKPITPDKKKTAKPKTEKRDFSQVALSIVEKVSGASLAKKSRN
jgi:hypothetical protein